MTKIGGYSEPRRGHAVEKVERFDQPAPTVVLERDGTRIGFAINGDGKQLRVFFVVAPNGLCYYFHEPIE